jgi:hypothetical protein
MADDRSLHPSLSSTPVFFSCDWCHGASRARRRVGIGAVAAALVIVLATTARAALTTIERRAGAADADRDAPVSFCMPVDKNGEGILDPEAHLTCFGIARTFDAPVVAVRNQFHDATLDLGSPEALCVPSLKFVFE